MAPHDSATAASALSPDQLAERCRLHAAKCAAARRVALAGKVCFWTDVRDLDDARRALAAFDRRPYSSRVSP